MLLYWTYCCLVVNYCCLVASLRMGSSRNLYIYEYMHFLKWFVYGFLLELRVLLFMWVCVMICYIGFRVIQFRATFHLWCLYLCGLSLVWVIWLCICLNKCRSILEHWCRDHVPFWTWGGFCPWWWRRGLFPSTEPHLSSETLEHTWQADHLW